MIARPTVCWLFVPVLLAFVGLGLSSQGFAQDLPWSVDVMCDGTKIGEFEITTYQVFGSGVEIEGCFNWNGVACDSCHNFRLLQVVYHDLNPPNLPDGSGPPDTPYVDPPKGGYQGTPFDGEPWYNQLPQDAGTPACPYPFYFYDRPEWKRRAQRGQANVLRFETWVVCFGDKPNTMCGLAHVRWGYDVNAAGDVTFKAPLDGANSLENAEIDTALKNGLFPQPEWTFSDNYLDCCLEPSDCDEEIPKYEPGPGKALCVWYSGANGTIRDVILTGNPPGCAPPDSIKVLGGNRIHFYWPTGCVNQGDVVQYQFTNDYPCEEIQPPTRVDWIYPQGYPTLSQWLLIILALSVGGFFVWQLMRRRKAAVSRSVG